MSPWILENDRIRGVFELLQSSGENDVRLTRIERRDSSGRLVPATIPGTNAAPRLHSFWVQLQSDPEGDPGLQPLRAILAGPSSFPGISITRDVRLRGNARTPGGSSELIIQWRGLLQSVGSLQGVGIPRSADVAVQIRWQLAYGDSELTCSATAQCFNDERADYVFRIWRLDFPIFDLGEFARVEGDRLLTSMYGGFVYHAPTRLGGRGLHLSHASTEASDHEVDDIFGGTFRTHPTINAANTDPGGLPMVLAAYYNVLDPDQPLVYFAVEDEEGMLKMFSVDGRGDEDGNPVDRLRFRLTNWNHAEDLLAQVRGSFDSYTIPYRIRLGMLRGDWVDAATRYRDSFRRFRDYPGPAGKPENAVVGPTLKRTFALVGEGTDQLLSYDRPHPRVGAADDMRRAVERSATMERFFTVGCSMRVEPMHILFRYPVHGWSDFRPAPYWDYSGDCAYCPPGTPSLCPSVRGEIRSRLPRNRVVLHGLSELLSQAWRYDEARTPPCSPVPLSVEGHDPGGVFPDWNSPLVVSNRVRLSPVPDGPPSPDPRERDIERRRGVMCASGKSGGSVDRSDWEAAFPRIMGQVAENFGFGGHVLSSPTFAGMPCFARNHAHRPGYGNAVALGWKDAYERFFAYATSKSRSDFVCGTEGAALFFTDTANLIADWSFSGYEPALVCGEYCRPGHAAPTRWEYYTCDALSPRRVESVPLMAFVAENVKKYHMFAGRNGGLWQSRNEQGYFFTRSIGMDYGPAVEASLRAWRQATTVISRQCLVYLENPDVSSIDGREIVPTPEQRAAQRMLEYARSLAALMQIEYRVGSGAAARGALGDFHGGSMERPVDLRVIPLVSDVTLGFKLPIGPFPVLLRAAPPAAAFLRSLRLSPPPIDVIDFGETSHFWNALADYLLTVCPRDLVLSPIRVLSSEFLSPAPHQGQSWLPSGVYRSAIREETICVLVTNPWVGEILRPAGAGTARINPFHYDWENPKNPGPNARPEYDFEFDLDPVAYIGTRRVSYQLLRIDEACSVVVQPRRNLEAPVGGALRFRERLAPGQTMAFVLRAR